MAVTRTYTLEHEEDLDTTGLRGNADAVRLSGGRVAVSSDVSATTSAAIYRGTGVVQGEESGITGLEGAVSALSDGNIVVATDAGGQASYRIIDGDGVQVVGDTPVGLSFSQLLDVDVAGGLAGGRFVVVSQAQVSGTNNDIRLTLLSNDGTVANNFAADLSTENDQNPSVAALNDGGFVVAWHRNIGSTNDLYYAIYEGSGAVRLAPTLLDGAGTTNRNPSVVARFNGGFAIAYEDTSWSEAVGGTDRDITLALLTASGTILGFTDLSQNTVEDDAPATSLLSNGIIAVGSIRGPGGDRDAVWTLADGATGQRLAASTTGSTGSDMAAAVAGTNNGRLMTFHTNFGPSPDVMVGQILLASRISNSDGADDVITGDDMRDLMFGNGGADFITGGTGGDSLYGGAGADTLSFSQNEAIGDFVDGGSEIDRLLILGDNSFSTATLQGIEEIEFESGAGFDRTVTLRADQIGPGLLSESLLVDGNLNGTIDTLRVVMGTDDLASLLAFTFTTFDTGPAEGDRIVMIGDDDGERMFGSSLRDEIDAGGGADSLRGGDGDDLLLAGAGDDRLLYATGDDGFDVADGGSGQDTVVALGSVDLRYVTFTGVEEIGIESNGAFVAIRAGQIGAGLPSTLRVDGEALGAAEVLQVLMDEDVSVNLSGFTFFDWDANRIFIIGDGDGESMTGSSQRDEFTGAGGDDLMAGGGGNDILNGDVGDDTLDGGAADDQLFGGDGNDGLRASSGADAFDGGAGLDFVNFGPSTGANIFLDGSGTNGRAAVGDSFIGIENLIGSLTGGDWLVGDGGANRLTGQGGDDDLWGRGGIDQLEGGAGLDELRGGAGADALVGGTQADRFVFDLTPVLASERDRITDWQPGVDKLVIDASAFGGGLLAGGAVQLRANANPTSAGAVGGVMLYDTDTGFLSWDADGQGAGAAVLFVWLQNLGALAAGDFLVVA